MIAIAFAALASLAARMLAPGRATVTYLGLVGADLLCDTCIYAIVIGVIIGAFGPPLLVHAAAMEDTKFAHLAASVETRSGVGDTVSCDRRGPSDATMLARGGSPEL